MELLRKLTETPGVPGREERVRQVILDEAGDLFGRTHVDAMGNLVCVREPRPAGKARKSAPPTTVMLACHMDEIGFYVSHVDTKSGFLRVQNVGGFDVRTLLGRRVVVQTARGDLFGVMNASKPIHVMNDEERKKIPEIGDVYVDLLMDAKRVAARVQVGDPVTLWQPMVEIGDAAVGKAMDDRVASWVAINAIRKATQHNCRIVYVATVQEEVGLRGAGPGAFGVQPDVAISIDVTIAADTPGVPDNQRVSTLGGGVALKVMDSSVITHRGLLDEWIAVARKNRIPHQLEILPRGGNDAGAIQRSAAGIKTGTLSIPCRYVHTVTETVSKSDLKAAVNLLAAYLAQA